MVEKQYLYGVPLQELPTLRYKKTLTPLDKTVVSDGINYELLDEVMNYIKEHPQSWHQASWYRYVDTETGYEWNDVVTEEVTEVNSCGAAFCFAGHVGMREGFPAPINNSVIWDRWIEDEELGYYNESKDGWGYSEDISEFARKRLGLRDDQAEALFDGDNSMENLETMVKILHELPDIDGWKMEDKVRYEELSFEEFMDWYNSTQELKVA